MGGKGTKKERTEQGLSKKQSLAPPFFMKKPLPKNIWLCLAIALIGLYLLCVNENFTFQNLLNYYRITRCVFCDILLVTFFKQKNIKSQQKKETQSKLNLIKKTTISEYILYSVSAVCLLIYGLQLFFNNVLNKDYKTFFSTFTPYIIIFCLFSIVFIIEFASSPQKTSSNKIISILSFSPIIFYILIIFDKFIACQGIINTVFLTFEFSLLCSLMLTLLSIPKLYLEDKVKYRFLSLSMCSVILSVVKLTDAILYLLNSLNADKIFKLISHLNYIDCDVYLYFANLILKYHTLIG